ncbi:MAG: hypothetical protein HY717_07045 [Planctomycetes bacterium]|nr:hypothetical protein [Planctomycetota bacterium]
MNTDLGEWNPDISGDWPQDGAILYFDSCLSLDPTWDCDLYQATWRFPKPAPPHPERFSPRRLQR